MIIRLFIEIGKKELYIDWHEFYWLWLWNNEPLYGIGSFFDFLFYSGSGKA